MLTGKKRNKSKGEKGRKLCEIHVLSFVSLSWLNSLKAHGLGQGVEKVEMGFVRHFFFTEDVLFLKKRCYLFT